ncbi:Aerobic respiration control sensor protein ArcB [Sulfitobacter sp. DSM 110093]|uniref:ATP-binding protein n=1 Tax=Sulfitobacter sp. DSM 110093 TaxID=2883127 RepID=UPI001FAD4924|nr:ATP-binding protein [Sulfitobacter sp. DSM 110093]UOA30863.1 Aerobic respiration control sensor protein ArcB [Sulfitobacter sp. DSM 110093]
MHDEALPAKTEVSRRRYQREQAARAEAEKLLEQKSRELYLANERLSAYSSELEKAVRVRTEELEEALKQAELAGRAKSRFLATMSHEIRTPLGGMLGMIDLLEMDETDPDKKELLKFAATAGTSLGRIVNDVLDFSKMEAGVFILEKENVDIRALIESVCALAGSNEATRHRNLNIEVSRDVPHIFLGDATRIRQVISNLVTNALRYSTDGPIHIRAAASQHPVGCLLRVEVEDVGIGISEDGKKDLFKDFSQVSNSLTAAAQGTGLGLAICKRIIESSGGVVGVASEVGVGSTFWFEVPVETGGLASADAEGGKRDQRNGNILDGKRVLIAEDNIINQKLLLTYADRLNLVADLAENGRIAVEMFDPKTYDLVLMDVAMPEMDGLEATQRIRQKWGAFTYPPIIALTAHLMDAIEEEASVVGIDTILSKPIPFAELKFALEVALCGQAPSADEAAGAAQDAVSATEGQGTSILDRMCDATLGDIRELFSEDKLIELAHKYVDDCSKRCERLEAQFDAGDAAAVRAEAHSIKGSSLMLGFNNIGEWAGLLEQTPLGDGEPRSWLNQIRSELAVLRTFT